MLIAPVSIIPFALVVFALAFWLTAWRRGRKPSARAMCISLTGLTIAFSINLFYPTVAAVLRLPSLPHLIQHAATLVFGYWLTVFCIHLSLPEDVGARRIRQRAWLLGLVLVALSTLYIVGPLRAGIPAIASEYGDRPFVSLYLAVFATHLGIVMVDVLIMSRHAGAIPRRWLRRGLRLLGTASVFGLLFVLQRASSSFADAFGHPFPWEDAGVVGVSSQLIIVAVVLLMAGVLVPPFGARWDDRKAARELDPLWRDLTAVAPELVFRSRHRPGLRAMVTEIHDVCIGPLQLYLDPAVADRARQLAEDHDVPAEHRQPVAEAAAIAVGLDAKRRDLPPLTTDPVLVGVPKTDDEPADVDRLVLIANAYVASPVVAQILEEFRDYDPAH
jgi:uncharacterized protein DUF6545